jgi:hypothetical protein
MASPPSNFQVLRIQRPSLKAKRLLYAVLRAGHACIPVRLLHFFVQRTKYEKIIKAVAPDIIFQGKMVASIERAPENEREMMPRLITSFSAAKRKQQSLSGPYAPVGVWEAYLKVHWRRYYEAIAGDDKETLARYLRSFFRNEALDGFWGKGIFKGFLESGDIESSPVNATKMLQHFAVWKAACPQNSIQELEAPRIGNPWGYLFDGSVLYEPVFEYHFQSQYFKRLLSGLQSPVIVEIGGGFGGLAYQILKAMPNAKYVGFDLPENILLQGYYLSCAFPHAKIHFYDGNSVTLDRKMLDSYNIVLMPNFELPQMESMLADLIINVRSLSEMALETIDEYFRQIDRVGRLFFFHENIFKARPDGAFGIPSTDFPELKNFVLAASAESRWPKYQRDTVYPCQENLFIHRRIFELSEK